MSRASTIIATVLVTANGLALLVTVLAGTPVTWFTVGNGFLFTAALVTLILRGGEKP